MIPSQAHEVALIVLLDCIGRVVKESPWYFFCALSSTWGMSAKRPCSDPAGNDPRKKQQLEPVMLSTSSTQEPLTVNVDLQAIPISEQDTESKTRAFHDKNPNEEPIKLFSSDQRLADLDIDEPTCIICGKYGEYINNITENDVCR